MKEIASKIARTPNWFIIVVLLTPVFGHWYLPPLIVYLIGAIIPAWYVSIAYELHSKLPEGVSLSFRWFLFTFFYGWGYGLIVSPYFMAGSPSSYIIPFHLFAMYCVLYGFYFISKGLVALEENKNVCFDRYLGTIFMLWFFPIGIWFFLPRLKKQLGDNN